MVKYIDWVKDNLDYYHYGITVQYALVVGETKKETEYRVTLINTEGKDPALYMLDESSYETKRYIGTVEELRKKLRDYVGDRKYRTIQTLYKALVKYFSKGFGVHRVSVLVEQEYIYAKYSGQGRKDLDVAHI